MRLPLNFIRAVTSNGRRFLLAGAAVLFSNYAQADIVNGPSFSFPIYQGQVGSSTNWVSGWYIPDPNNSYCPSGQFYMITYSDPHMYMHSNKLGIDCILTTMSSMYAVWNNMMSSGYYLSGSFSCPVGTQFDNSSGNCLRSLTMADPSVAAEFFVWAFGGVLLCWAAGLGCGRVISAIREASRMR